MKSFTTSVTVPSSDAFENSPVQQLQLAVYKRSSVYLSFCRDFVIPNFCTKMNGCLRTDQHLQFMYSSINNFASVVTYHSWKMEACIISMLKNESGEDTALHDFFNVFSALSVSSPIVKENIDWTTPFFWSWSSEAWGNPLFWQCRVKLWVIALEKVSSIRHSFSWKWWSKLVQGAFPFCICCPSWKNMENVSIYPQLWWENTPISVYTSFKTTSYSLNYSP